MKHHDLLAELNKSYDGLFEITVLFKQREVMVAVKDGLWDYGLDYDIFQAVPVSKLAKEVVYAYENRR